MGGVAAAAGALALVGWLWQDGVRVGLEGYVGAGATQEAFSFERSVRIASVEAAQARLLGLTALALLVVGAALAVWPARPLVLAVLAVSCALVIEEARASRFTPGVHDEHGVQSCDRARESDPGACAGGVLRAAVERLRSEALRSPTGRRPGFHLLEGYWADVETGWRLLRWPPRAAALLAAYVAVRLVVRRRLLAVAVVAGATLFLLAWLVLRALSRLE